MAGGVRARVRALVFRLRRRRERQDNAPTCSLATANPAGVFLSNNTHAHTLARCSPRPPLLQTSTTSLRRNHASGVAARRLLDAGRGAAVRPALGRAAAHAQGLPPRHERPLRLGALRRDRRARPLVRAPVELGQGAAALPLPGAGAPDVRRGHGRWRALLRGRRLRQALPLAGRERAAAA
eukprot:scaffold123957_cov54-Phaeocystis_antarctica.AAC.1